MKKLFTLLSIVFYASASAQTTPTGCNNSGFEIGDFTNWTGAIGYNGNSKAPLVVTSPAISTLGNNSPETSCAFHTIITASASIVDPYGGFPAVSPNGGGFSCRLGGENINLSCDEYNPSSLYSQHFGVVSPTVACTSTDPVMTNTASPQFGNQFFSNGESLEQTFTVDPSSSFFTYNYAVVLSSAPHTGADINYFKVEVIASNTLVPCLTYVVQSDTASSNLPPGFFTSSSQNSFGGPVIYSPWQQSSINLMPYIGQTVTIKFTVAGCTQGGHFAYAYIDCGCSATAFPLAPQGCITGNASILAQSQVGGTYAWSGPGIVGGVSSQNVIVNQPGTYSVTVTNQQGCAYTKDTTINFTQAPTLTVTGGTTMCASGTATLTANGATTYTWSTNDTGAVISPSVTATTIYTVTGTQGACNASATATVTISSPVLTYTLVQDLAPHTWDLYYSSTGGSQPYTYNFNWGDGSTSNTAYPSHTYSVAGTYSICATITDNFGCASTYCQNDAVFRSGNNSTYSNMVYVNVKSGTAGALVYQKLLADSVTEFDINAPCFGSLKHNNSTQQTLSNCVNVNQYMHNIFYAKGDSLYTGKTYKKITYNNVFQGLMREDTAAKKVYFIQYCNTNEQLLYNFSLSVGDTITYSFTNPGYYMPSGVYKVDSIKLKHDYTSYYHKHFYLRNHSSVNNITLEMIEGVGNVSHPLFLYYNFNINSFLFPSTTCTAANFNEALSCKFDNGTKIYADSMLYQLAIAHEYAGGNISVCNYCLGSSGGIEQYNVAELVTISPNPNNGNFTVEVSGNQKQTLQLFDINGRLVLTQTMQNKTTIDVSNFNAGVYNLSLISNEGVVNKRVIIVK